MTANALLGACVLAGVNPIGLRINTVGIGGYTGGPAVITEVAPDRNAPEIIFTVAAECWIDEDGNNSIGVFSHEPVQVIGLT